MKLCSNCKHGSTPGEWVNATKNNARHRRIECQFKIPDLPKWVTLGMYHGRYIVEYWNRTEVTCKCWEKK